MLKRSQYEKYVGGFISSRGVASEQLRCSSNHLLSLLLVLLHLRTRRETLKPWKSPEISGPVEKKPMKRATKLGRSAQKVAALVWSNQKDPYFNGRWRRRRQSNTHWFTETKDGSKLSSVSEWRGGNSSATARRRASPGCRRTSSTTSCLRWRHFLLLFPHPSFWSPLLGFVFLLFILGGFSSLPFFSPEQRSWERLRGFCCEFLFLFFFFTFRLLIGMVVAGVDRAEPPTSERNTDPESSLD